MPLAFERVDRSQNGWGWFASCGCQDKDFHVAPPGMHDLVVRAAGAIEVRIRRKTPKFDPKDVIEYKARTARAGVKDEYVVLFSIGTGDPGPHWYCKHMLAVYREVLYGQGYMPLAFTGPDAIRGTAPGYVTLKLDGWLEVLCLDKA